MVKIVPNKGDRPGTKRQERTACQDAPQKSQRHPRDAGGDDPLRQKQDVQKTPSPMS